MKWSELEDNDFYIPWDENQSAIRGFWLIKQEIDLENLPMIFNEQFRLFDKLADDDSDVVEQRKVYLKDIIGTSHKDYGNMEIIKSYMRLKRAKDYIVEDWVTLKKYNKMLRKPVNEQNEPKVMLALNEDGTYFVDGNGNHRIILYKMMMFSEIARKYPCVSCFNRESFKDITQKYWLYAEIKKKRNSK